MSVDYNSLNTRQKLNLLSLRIRKEYTERRHGSHIKIATTEEDAVQESGFMALPTARIAPGKQLYMRMGEVKELPSGSFATVRKASDVTDPQDSVDLLDALEAEEQKLYGDRSIVKRARAVKPGSVDDELGELLEDSEDLGALRSPRSENAASWTKKLSKFDAYTADGMTDEEFIQSLLK